GVRVLGFQVRDDGGRLLLAQPLIRVAEHPTVVRTCREDLLRDGCCRHTSTLPLVPCRSVSTLPPPTLSSTSATRTCSARTRVSAARSTCGPICRRCSTGSSASTVPT